MQYREHKVKHSLICQKSKQIWPKRSASSQRLSSTSHLAKFATLAIFLSLISGGCEQTKDAPLAQVFQPIQGPRVDPALLVPVPKRVCLAKKPEKMYKVKELLAARACEEDQKRRIEARLLALQRVVREWDKPSQLGMADLYNDNEQN